MTPVSPVPTIHPAGDARAALSRLEAAITRVIHGKPAVVRLAVAALAARGHVLIEDVPGVGKTTLARALARAVGGTFRRIQFTSDLLPSDILGVSIFNQETGRFEFRKGPIFANVVLAGGSAGEPLGRAREEAERVMNELLERIAVPS